jgi:hypothetical protein
MSGTHTDSQHLKVDHRQDPDPRALAWGVSSRHENLWPARAAVLASMGLYLTLPDRLTVGPTWLLPALEFLMLVPLMALSPVRHRRESRIQHVLSLALAALINLANLGSLVLLISALLHHNVPIDGKPIDGPLLLQASLQIWLTNVLCFALWYWLLDRGGPMYRRLRHHPQPDFLFPQMTTPGCTVPEWTPTFVDYLYVSFTNATAFSPTDTLPLTHWAKLLMSLQALISLLTVALVAARAVNILS